MGMNRTTRSLKSVSLIIFNSLVKIFLLHFTPIKHDRKLTWVLINTLQVHRKIHRSGGGRGGGGLRSGICEQLTFVNS